MVNKMDNRKIVKLKTAKWLRFLNQFANYFEDMNNMKCLF